MGNSSGWRGPAGRRRLLFLFLLSLLSQALSQPIRYAIPQELDRGSLVGNLAKDLGFGVGDLPTRNLRVIAEKKFFTVSPENGDLFVSDHIDREEICGKKSTCVLEFEMVAEKPLNVFHVTVLIQDINDNPPTFSENITELEISELAITGATFAMESAQDPDVGVNSLQQYYLSPDPHFSLIQKENLDGSRYLELVLKAPLEREEQLHHHLVLTAVDVGEPSRSCTTQIRVIIADANDNPPVFTQDMYRVSVAENLPAGSFVLKVMATDLDEGVNAEIIYAYINIGKAVRQLFKLDSKTGELTTVGELDFEESDSYTIRVEAKDGGHHTTYCKVQIDISDENDNAPEITLTSESQHIQEDAELGTAIALIKTHDLDSGFNGEILCQLKGKFPFKIVQDTKNTYRLVTDGALDREQIPEYNVTITATDKGNPPLSSSKTITLHILDANDNVPVFHQASYTVHVAENNPPGASIAHVSASDPDLGPNGSATVSPSSGVGLDLGALPPRGDSGHRPAPRRSSRPATEGYFQPGLYSKTIPGALPNYSERTLLYSYNLCAASHSSNTEFKFLNIKAEDAVPQDLLCDEASWFESNDNPKMPSNSGNLQQVSFFKPFLP
uniref:Protocadherin gamma subfamily B, 3 n=1 Tax=Rhinopithecus roxellana TaxID=61622 RepID=A0A2K6R7N4_RHIRO